MTKLSASSQKPPAEVGVTENRVEDDVDDEELKKNLYSEIDDEDLKKPINEEGDDSKVPISTSTSTTTLAETENAANENLYAEIHLDDDHFENAVYMQNVVLDYPAKSPATRSFYPIHKDGGARVIIGTVLPTPPSEKIPEEPEPSWCCGTRRRRRRNVIFGLVVLCLFLLILCVALFVKLFGASDNEDRFLRLGSGGANGLHAHSPTAAALAFTWTNPGNLVSPETAFYESGSLGNVPNATVNNVSVSSRGPTTTTTLTSLSSSKSINPMTTSSTGAASSSGLVMSTSAPLMTTTTSTTPNLISGYVCTSWLKTRKFSIKCPEGKAIEVSRAFYGWSISENYCYKHGSDTRCTEDMYSHGCNGKRECTITASKSGLSGNPASFHCYGFHDYLQIFYYCNPS